MADVTRKTTVDNL